MSLAVDSRSRWIARSGTVGIACGNSAHRQGTNSSSSYMLIAK